MNRNYQRSRSREQAVKLQLEKEGYYAIRSAGSKGIADIVGTRPVAPLTNPQHFVVRFIQIKVSEKIKEQTREIRSVDSSCGLIDVEFWHFPVKSKKWHDNNKQIKKKKLSRLSALNQSAGVAKLKS